MPDTYQTPWGSITPGYLVFLLDQSSSTALPLDADQPNQGKRICDVIATTVNALLQELVLTNTVVRVDGTLDVRPRADISILGYGNGNACSLLPTSKADEDWWNLAEIGAHPIEMICVTTRELNPRGEEIERTIEVPIWVHPDAQGDAPLCQAIQKAYALTQAWVKQHPNSFPPIIITLSTGLVSDGDPAEAARQLCSVSTTDGHTLLCLGLIMNKPDYRRAYPHKVEDLPYDLTVRNFFALTSEVPISLGGILLDEAETRLQPGARCFIINGDIQSYSFVFGYRHSHPSYLDSLDVNR